MVYFLDQNQVRKYKSMRIEFTIIVVQPHINNPDSSEEHEELEAKIEFTASKTYTFIIF